MSDEDIKYINEYICEHMKFERCAKGKSIIKYGDRGTKFYIILEGKVSVLVPPQKLHVKGEIPSSKVNSMEGS